MEIVDFLTKQIGFPDKKVVADIGSGTGKMANIFLKNGNLVFGVEPNGPMQQAAASLFKTNKQFKSINGAAEATGLSNRSIDLITCS